MALLLILASALCDPTHASRMDFAGRIRGNKYAEYRRVRNLKNVSCEDQARYYRRNFAVEYLGQEPASRLLHRMRGKWECRNTKLTGVICVGANHGQDNDYFAKEFSNDCWGDHTKVYLFEPNPHLLPILERSIAAANEKGNVSFELLNVAASDKNGTALFNKLKKSQHSSFVMHSTEFTITVPTARLDDWAEEKGITRVPLLMVDTEGFDTLVLRGAERIFPIVEAIIWECSDLMDKFGFSLKQTSQYLADHGFISYHIGRFRSILLTAPYWHEWFDRKKFQNCYSVKPKSPLHTEEVIPGPCTHKLSGEEEWRREQQAEKRL